MPIPQRGDIYAISILDGVGHEQRDAKDGPHWYVVISPDAANRINQMFLAVPLTSVISKISGKPKDEGPALYRYCRIRLEPEDKQADAGNGNAGVFQGGSIVLTEQARSFSTERLDSSNRAGKVLVTGLAKIDAGLQFMIGAPIGRKIMPTKSLPTEPPRPMPGNPS